MTFGAKDVFDVAGARTGCGHPRWLEEQRPALRTAAAVQRLLDAGAQLVGKTVTDELAYSLSGENSYYGTPRNPHDDMRVPGGSSSGSASAVACGLVDFALGADCAGSVRIPASYCGTFGFRPTHGTVSLDGTFPFAPSFDVVGWFARTPEVLRKVGTALLPPDAAEHPHFVGGACVSDAFAELSPEAVAALEPAVDRIGRGWSGLVDVHLSGDGLEVWFQTFRTLQAAEIWHNLGQWVTAAGPAFGPGIEDRFAWAARVTAADVERARRARERAVADIADCLVPGRALVLPTAPGIAPLKGAATSDTELAVRHRAMRLLCIAGLAGLPQVTLPLATLDRMPLGVSLIGPRGADRQLLDLAVDVVAGLSTNDRTT